MNKFFTILLLSLLSFSSHAQVNVDSLLSMWNDKSQSDTNRLKALGTLTYNHYLNNALYDSVIFYSQKMLELSEEKELKKYQADALHYLGNAEWMTGQTDVALDLMTRGLAIQEEIGNKAGIGQSLANIGEYYRFDGQLLKGLNHFNRALSIFEEIQDQALIGHLLSLIGITNSELGNFPNAIKYLSRSIDVAEKSGNTKTLAYSFLNMSSMFQKINDNVKAKKYAERAYEVAKKNQLVSLELYALILFAEIYGVEGDYEKALTYCDTVLLSFNEAIDVSIRVKALELKADIYKKQGDYDQALSYYKMISKDQELLNGEFGVFYNAIAFGTIYRLKKEGQKAVKWCTVAFVSAQNLAYVEGQVEACQCLYESYKMLNNGNKALEYHELLLTLNDGLQKDESTRKLQQIEFEKQMLADSIATADKERLIQEAHEEEVRKKNRTRNIFAGSGLLFLMIAGGVYSQLHYVRKSKASIEKEKERSENLLLNILPAEIAEELKEKGKAEARDFEMVSILFTDFKGFTEQSAKLNAADLVNEINHCFEAFDGIMEIYGIEKIKTIGDAYMAAGGLPVPTDDSIKNTVLAALEMQAFISKRKSEMDLSGRPAFEMRVGIHTGAVVAGIVGVKKFQYDIWGDTVNTASRIESSGEVDKVNISQTTYEMLKDDLAFTFQSRGKIEAKGKGEIEMYFVSLKTKKE